MIIIRNPGQFFLGVAIFTMAWQILQLIGVFIGEWWDTRKYKKQARWWLKENQELAEEIQERELAARRRQGWRPGPMPVKNEGDEENGKVQH